MYRSIVQANESGDPTHKGIDTEKMIFMHAHGFNPEKAKSFSRCSRTQTRSGIYSRVLDIIEKYKN